MLKPKTNYGFDKIISTKALDFIKNNNLSENVSIVSIEKQKRPIVVTFKSRKVVIKIYFNEKLDIIKHEVIEK